MADSEVKMHLEPTPALRTSLPARVVRTVRRYEANHPPGLHTRWAMSIPENVQREEIIRALRSRFPWFAVNQISNEAYSRAVSEDTDGS